MAADKTQQYLSSLRQQVQDADYSEDCKTAILDFLDAYNPDVMRLKPPIIQGKDQRESTLTTSSRYAYVSALHNAAQYVDLLQCTADDLNRLADARFSGEHESVSDDGIQRNTVNQNQTAWRSFARFHVNHPQGHDIEVDPDEIVLVGREETTVDERDMFDADEIQAMRNACRNKRDRAILELLIYTGQRHNALRMLTVDDVRPDEGDSGMIYLPDVEGMKGADGKRPLLGAQKAAREWKQAHPTGSPDDAYFTHLYEWDGRDDIEQGDHLSRQSFGKTVTRIGERAGVEKDANPHQFRHYFVTMAISKHGMSMDTVRHLIGHAAGSRELERTYQHLVDDDHIENAELDMGIREEREESLTPPQCFTCNEPLEPSNNFCPNCGHTYGPQAAQVDDEVDAKKAEGALAATDEQMTEDLQTLFDVMDDPEKFDQLVTLVESLDADSLDAAADEVSR